MVYQELKDQKVTRARREKLGKMEYRSREKRECQDKMALKVSKTNSMYRLYPVNNV